MLLVLSSIFIFNHIIYSFIITDKQSNDIRYLKAKVISAGDMVKGVSDGDIIHYDKHAGHGIEWEDKLYQVIQHQDIVIVE